MYVNYMVGLYFHSRNNHPSFAKKDWRDSRKNKRKARKMNNKSYYNKLKNKKLTDFEEEESPEEE